MFPITQSSNTKYLLSGMLNQAWDSLAENSWSTLVSLLTLSSCTQNNLLFTSWETDSYFTQNKIKTTMDFFTFLNSQMIINHSSRDYSLLIYNKPLKLLELVMTLDGQRASLLDFLSDSLFCQYMSSPMNHKNGRKNMDKHFVSIWPLPWSCFAEQWLKWRQSAKSRLLHKFQPRT